MASRAELEKRIEALERLVGRLKTMRDRERKALAKAREIITTHETRLDTLTTRGRDLANRVAALEAA